MFDLHFDKRKKKQKKTTQNKKMYKCNSTCQKYVTWGWIHCIYNIESGCVELASIITFDRIVIIVYRICNFCFICYVVGLLNIFAIFQKCMIKSKNSHCLYLRKLHFNASKLYQNWKKLANVCHIFNVFKFRVIFSTFSNLDNTIYMLESLD